MTVRLGRRYDAACRVLVARMRDGMRLPAEQEAVLLAGQATEGQRSALRRELGAKGLSSGGAERPDKGSINAIRVEEY